jgi:hypothetical protein
LLLFHFAYNKFWLYSYAFLIFCPRAKSFHRTSMNSFFFSVCTSDGKIPSVCGGKKKKIWFRFSFFFFFFFLCVGSCAFAVPRPLPIR